MSFGRLTLVLLAASALSCRSEASGDPMTITDVIANIDRLNGRTVRVAGYLMECGGYECRLYRSQAEKEQGERYFRELVEQANAGRELNPTVAEPPFLGIGVGENWRFDAMAEPFANSYVVITGRVTNQCRDNGEPSCLHRTTDLEPVGITRWTPSGAEAGNAAWQ
ncbi:MAG: hypothetical protein M3N07_01610 [Pseudomonadota bacterium]|nr:hypothetical protein [Pseudomonadota bacterium]